MDSGWLDTLSVQDPFAAQEGALQWLKTFVEKATSALDRSSFEALLQADQRCADNTQGLVARYLGTSMLSFEDEDRLWEAVHSHHYYFSRAWLSFVGASVDNPDQFSLQEELPLIVARALFHLSSAAKWHYFRYKPVPVGHWRRMHILYELAEHSGFAGRLMTLDGGETTCTAAYLRALMLGTVSRADMSKQEIELVDSWLDEWVRSIPLEAAFEEEWQLFYVDFSADIGGRRIRNFEPTHNCRYWDTDNIVRLLERTRTSLQQGLEPVGIVFEKANTGVDYPKLIHHLLAEWSRSDNYKRQRRSEERDPVKKKAQAIHGVFGVCQHVKNVMFARRSTDNTLVMEQSEFADEIERWVIENESPRGFGATVDPALETWLKVGRLIALDYELNKDMTVVGVVRNINQQPSGKSYIGIQALSHMPTYVLLRAADILQAEGKPSFDLMPPFPGIYLPRDEAIDAVASLILPVIEFVAAGLYELRMENRPYLVSLGDSVEQKDDWVRVQVQEIKMANSPD